MNVHDDESVERALRGRLLQAVPPLSTPPDRLGAVTARAHRNRRRTMLGSAAAMLVLFGGIGTLLTDHIATPHHPGQPVLEQPNPASDCVALTPVAAGALATDRPGPLVPAGATSATRCETRTAPATPGPQGGPNPTDVTPQTLIVDVGQFTAALNVLPSIAANQACTLVGYPTDLSFVFTFTDLPPVVVRVDRNCGLLATAEHVRSYRGSDPLAQFDALYAAQNGNHH